MAEEKEIILDLSKKIKWNDNKYISLGSLLLSGIILIIQGITMGWSGVLLLNFIYAIRADKNAE